MVEYAQPQMTYAAPPMTYAAPPAPVTYAAPMTYAAPAPPPVTEIAAAMIGQTRQAKVPTTTMKGAPGSVQAFQPSYTQERVQGQAVIVPQPQIQIEGAAVVVGQNQMENVVQGQVSQNVIEIPTVSEQVNEIIVPEISTIETIVE